MILDLFFVLLFVANMDIFIFVAVDPYLIPSDIFIFILLNSTGQNWFLKGAFQSNFILSRTRQNPKWEWILPCVHFTSSDAELWMNFKKMNIEQK